MTREKTGACMNCSHCGKSVYVPKNRIDKFKFCSRRCMALGSRVESSSECSVCGSIFNHISSRANKAKYCSRTCYYKSMNKMGSVEKECEFCKKKFLTSPSKNKSFCSIRCSFDNRMIGSGSPASFGSARKWMNARGLISACRDCGYSEEPRIIGVHHDDENRNNNSISNLIPLCPNCHSLRHMKHVVHGPDSKKKPL